MVRHAVTVRPMRLFFAILFCFAILLFFFMVHWMNRADSSLAMRGLHKDRGLCYDTSNETSHNETKLHNLSNLSKADYACLGSMEFVLCVLSLIVLVYFGYTGVTENAFKIPRNTLQTVELVVLIVTCIGCVALNVGHLVAVNQERQSFRNKAEYHDKEVKTIVSTSSVIFAVHAVVQLVLIWNLSFGLGRDSFQEIASKPIKVLIEILIPTLMLFNVSWSVVNVFDGLPNMFGDSFFNHFTMALAIGYRFHCTLSFYQLFKGGPGNGYEDPEKDDPEKDIPEKDMGLQLKSKTTNVKGKLVLSCILICLITVLYVVSLGFTIKGYLANTTDVHDHTAHEMLSYCGYEGITTLLFIIYLFCHQKEMWEEDSLTEGSNDIMTLTTLVFAVVTFCSNMSTGVLILYPGSFYSVEIFEELAAWSFMVGINCLLQGFLLGYFMVKYNSSDEAKGVNEIDIKVLSYILSYNFAFFFLDIFIMPKVPFNTGLLNCEMSSVMIALTIDFRMQAATLAGLLLMSMNYPKETNK
eukprot:m.339344 g.339344  ORF g.339344 m.339344 type:complete len:525 (+) comp18767_c0_seq1:46-1620(+)